MGKSAPFILDRPDFIQMLEALPPSAHRDSLADRLRDARQAYRAHCDRRPEILTALEAVGREITAAPSDMKSAAKAAALSAELAVHPTVAAERARAFADALTVWATETYRAFQIEHDRAVDAINAGGQEWREVVSRNDRLQFGTREREQNEAEITRLRHEAAPHYALRDTCRRGMAAIQTAVSFTIGSNFIHGRPAHGDVERFVQRVVKAVA